MNGFVTMLEHSPQLQRDTDFCLSGCGETTSHCSGRSQFLQIGSRFYKSTFVDYCVMVLLSNNLGCNIVYFYKTVC